MIWYVNILLEYHMDASQVNNIGSFSSYFLDDKVRISDNIYSVKEEKMRKKTKSNKSIHNE